MIEKEDENIKGYLSMRDGIWVRVPQLHGSEPVRFLDRVIIVISALIVAGGMVHLDVAVAVTIILLASSISIVVPRIRALQRDEFLQHRTVHGRLLGIALRRLPLHRQLLLAPLDRCQTPGRKEKKSENSLPFYFFR